MYGKTLDNQPTCLTPGNSVFSNFVTFRQCAYGKLEKQSLWSFLARPRKLLIRHSFSTSEMLGLLCHVIVRDVEHHVLLQLSLSRNLWSREPILL
jgi:hypothetical protein